MLFGTGCIGKEAIPFMEENHRILFWVDNNEHKWGSIFEKYPVYPPDALLDCNCNVVITSVKYANEIAGQLQGMGIAADRIYFCRKYQAGDVYRYEAFPFSWTDVNVTGKPLVQYDLCQAEEVGTNRRKVLIFCSFYSVYTKQLIENMSKRLKDIEFSLLTNARESKEKIVAEQLKHIYYFQTVADLKTILLQLPVYDAMQLQWMEYEWVYFHELIRERTQRLNLNIGGSDFYRAAEGERNCRKALIECADCIVAQTEETMRNFVTYYGEGVKSKTVVLPYGVEVLDRINDSQGIPKNSIRQKYGISADKIIVTCGHNAGEAHQHIKMIDALDKLSADTKARIVCVFPMNYPGGKDEYIGSVSAALDKTGIGYMILTEFMDFQEMAEYAMISDIMIHVQTTDQLSSAMLEEMYAGAVIIAGKWLPYRSLRQKGLFFLDVDMITELTPVIEEVAAELDKYKEKCKNNRQLIWDNSSWDELTRRWSSLWERPEKDV